MDGFIFVQTVLVVLERLVMPREASLLVLCISSCLEVAVLFEFMTLIPSIISGNVFVQVKYPFLLKLLV